MIRNNVDYDTYDVDIYVCYIIEYITVSRDAGNGYYYYDNV